jgi:protein TonB
MVRPPFALRRDQSLAFIFVITIHLVAGYGLWQTLRYISPPVIIPAQPLQVELLIPHLTNSAPKSAPSPTQPPQPMKSNQPAVHPKPQPKVVHQAKKVVLKPRQHKKIAKKPNAVNHLLEAPQHKAAPKKVKHQAQPAPAQEALQTPKPTVPPAAPAHPTTSTLSTQTAAAESPMTREPAVYNADYLHNPAPAYPRHSLRLGETGKVLLLVFVSSSGQAEEVKIKASSGYERLDEAALNAVRKWRFTPARENGVAVAGWVTIPIIFKLQG